jgi:2-hydroxychromene-2-carboxylate isomerase
MAGDVLCWFDYSSPFAYLGTERITPIADAHGARVVYRPFLLGALFRAIGTPLVPIDVMPAAKARYFRLELDRWAAHAGIPFVYSSHFPVRTVDALRLTLLVPEHDRARIVRSIMRATWALDRDPNDPEVLAECCRDAGVDPALAHRVKDAKAALVEATDAAIALSIPGAPTFQVGSELFWGQDRLLFVEQALAGGRPGRPNRASMDVT